MEHEQQSGLPQSSPPPFHSGVFSTGAEPGAIARDVLAALSPIVSVQGIAALFERCMLLAGTTHPWLRAPIVIADSRLDFDALESAFAAQEPQDAMSGAYALLRSFRQVLDRMLGPAFAERILAPVQIQSRRGMDSRRRPQ